MHPIIDFAFIWFIWAIILAPMMWRLHVRLPRSRQLAEDQPDSPRKERDLRRIDMQLNHAWASRKGLVKFFVLTSVLFLCTLVIVLLKVFHKA